MQLEEEQKPAQEEAEHLESHCLTKLRAKEELERQAADQIKSQEQLVAEITEYTQDRLPGGGARVLGGRGRGVTAPGQGSPG